MNRPNPELLFSSRRTPVRENLVTLMVLATLGILIAESIGFQQMRASKRSLESEAAEVASFLPEHEPVWVLGPSVVAGKDASLFFYLRRPVVAFRPESSLPPAGSHCVLTSNRLGELAGADGFIFDQIARVEYPRWDYLVGRCSQTVPD